MLFPFHSIFNPPVLTRSRGIEKAWAFSNHVKNTSCSVTTSQFPPSHWLSCTPLPSHTSTLPSHQTPLRYISSRRRRGRTTAINHRSSRSKRTSLDDPLLSGHSSQRPCSSPFPPLCGPLSFKPSESPNSLHARQTNLSHQTPLNTRPPSSPTSDPNSCVDAAVETRDAWDEWCDQILHSHTNTLYPHGLVDPSDDTDTPVKPLAAESTKIGITDSDDDELPSQPMPESTSPAISTTSPTTSSTSLSATSYNDLSEHEEMKELLEALSELDNEWMPRLEHEFVDKIRIGVMAGDGGSPVKNTPRRKIPNGPGFGGTGGDVIVTVVSDRGDLRGIPQNVRAKNGADAKGTSRGKHAHHLLLRVPQGTIIRKRIADPSSLNRKGKPRKLYVYWHQLLQHNESMLIAKGGRGGVGMSSAKAKDGRKAEKGHSIHVELELRLTSDAVLIGLPNGGKSSLMAAMTRKLGRISPQPYSTTYPQRGLIKYDDGHSINVLDLPPIVEGSSRQGGDAAIPFRHLYRTRLLVYVVDGSGGNLPVQNPIAEEHKQLTEGDGEGEQAKRTQYETKNRKLMGKLVGM
eukprot:GHVN01059012.1.p1 GENE.GHVN01059012.1~~GHVN01059012.1.p1  ORF type:complete len:574 (-),score=102.60 GHVN01059012.1:1541-3262(-)